MTTQHINFVRFHYNFITPAKHVSNMFQTMVVSTIHDELLLKFDDNLISKANDALITKQTSIEMLVSSRALIVELKRICSDVLT